jgi:hypothetical protein
MVQTQLGKKVEGWSESQKQELKTDLDKLTKVPRKILDPIVDKIARTSPACNVADLVAVEADNHSLSDWRDLGSSVAAVSFVMNNLAGQSPTSVADELSSILSLSKEATKVLNELLLSAQPFRESAEAASTYIRVGAPLFSTIRGTVDLRLRFHQTEREFVMGGRPSRIHGVSPVVMVDLTLALPDEEKETIQSFVMDENDLKFMKRFVSHMERELELGKEYLNAAEFKSNG